MSSVQEIESALTQLPLEDFQSVRDWLDDFIEERVKLRDNLRARIERAKRETASGVHSRTRQPQAGQ